MISGLGLAPVEVLNSTAVGPVLLVCEHASNHFPPQFEGLGLSKGAQAGHISWDPGAMAVALYMSRLLDAKLVAGTVSRLIYDCNRPPEAAGAMAVESEIFTIPGNAGLTTSQRQERVDQVYRPFTDSLAKAILQSTMPPVLVTIHSFTKNYMGNDRAVEVGILHDTDTRLADVMLSLAPSQTEMRVMRNEPYGPKDGVTHTLQKHGISNGLMNVMIEVRNDLIVGAEQQLTVAKMLANLLTASIAELTVTQITKGAECHK